MRIYMPRYEVEALVNALRHHTFGYTDEARHAAAAWRALARWIGEDPYDGQFPRVVEPLAVPEADDVLTLDRESASSRASRRRRAVTDSAMADQ